MAHPRDLTFYIVIYREILKQFSSQEMLHQMGHIWPSSGGLNFYIVIYK